MNAAPAGDCGPTPHLCDGRNGNDLLTGGDDADDLLGEGGADRFEAGDGTGTDWLDGGVDADTDTVDSSDPGDIQRAETGMGRDGAGGDGGRYRDLSICTPPMPRDSLGGVVYHMLNRGNRGRRVFFAAADYLAFLVALAEACRAVPGVRVLARGPAATRAGRRRCGGC